MEAKKSSACSAAVAIKKYARVRKCISESFMFKCFAGDKGKYKIPDAGQIEEYWSIGMMEDWSAGLYYISKLLLTKVWLSFAVVSAKRPYHSSCLYGRGNSPS